MSEKTALVYRLTHYYDIGDQSKYFTFDDVEHDPADLAVYLQFKAEEIFDDSICLPAEAILGYLTTFGAKQLKSTDANVVIDMYDDRELRCGDWYCDIYAGLDSQLGVQAESYLRGFAAETVN
ncbi:hypothetical protein [Aliagarivorans taiwanensis]|uniref:hypothetical protein n=1 Tax=Aliagarivorans taiwanensis TaxID=561966 RepID=UPI000479380B|nr:hypothetical protein [Aliagarivorans taiwanensis]